MDAVAAFLKKFGEAIGVLKKIILVGPTINFIITGLLLTDDIVSGLMETRNPFRSD